MRILIIPNGKAEIISLSTSPSAASTKLNFFKKQKKENLINSYNERLKSSNNKENKKKRKLNSLNTERKNILNINIKKLKESDLVNIKELYNKPLKNIKEKTYHRIKTTNQIKSISLYDLMNKNVYNDMLNQMKKENDDKEKNCNVNNFQFRNHLSLPHDIPKIIDKVKNYSNFSDRQLEKDNQLCKIILNNRKKDNIYKRIAEKKIKLKYNYNNNLDRMKRDILCSARIINKYNNIKSNRELIKQNYEDFKRTYWKNLNIDHSQKKKILSNEFD